MTAPAEYCLGWDEFHRDTRELARRLLGQHWHGILAVARGGLVPAAIIARELEIRLVDTLCIASYDHTRQGEMNILKGVEGNGEGWLIVDDLVDTGKTARLLREMLPAATLATVYAKPAGKPLADIVIRDFPQDVWVHFPWDVETRYSPPFAAGT